MEVSEISAMRIAVGSNLLPAPMAGNDGRSCCLRLGNQVKLCRYRVDAIDDVVVFRKIEFACRIGQVEAFVLGDFAAGVYVEQAFLHGIYFIHADGFPGCDYLAVYIRQAHLVVVDDIDGAQSAAHERFADVAAYAAAAKHDNVGFLQRFNAVAAKCQTGAGKLIEHGIPFLDIDKSLVNVAIVEQKSPLD